MWIMGGGDHIYMWSIMHIHLHINRYSNMYIDNTLSFYGVPDPIG